MDRILNYPLRRPSTLVGGEFAALAAVAEVVFAGTEVFAGTDFSTVDLVVVLLEAD